MLTEEAPTATINTGNCIPHIRKIILGSTILWFPLNQRGLSLKHMVAIVASLCSSTISISWPYMLLHSSHWWHDTFKDKIYRLAAVKHLIYKRSQIDLINPCAKCFFFTNGEINKQRNRQPSAELELLVCRLDDNWWYMFTSIKKKLIAPKCIEINITFHIDMIRCWSDDMWG